LRIISTIFLWHKQISRQIHFYLATKIEKNITQSQQTRKKTKTIANRPSNYKFLFASTVIIYEKRIKFSISADLIKKRPTFAFSIQQL